MKNVPEGLKVNGLIIRIVSALGNVRLMLFFYILKFKKNDRVGLDYFKAYF